MVLMEDLEKLESVGQLVRQVQLVKQVNVAKMVMLDNVGQQVLQDHQAPPAPLVREVMMEEREPRG